MKEKIKSVPLKLLVVFAAFCLLVSGVAAAYWIYGNTATVNVVTYTLTLTPTVVNVTRYHLANFTATLKRNNIPVSGATIVLFHQNGTQLASNQTSTDGTCILRFNVTQPEGSTFTVKPGYLVP